MTIKLSDIPQLDSFRIIAAATRQVNFCHVRDQFVFTTMQLCRLLRTDVATIDQIAASMPLSFGKDECFTLQDEELLEVIVAAQLQIPINRPARFWTPRAALRVAALLTNPVAKAIHLQVAAFASSIEAQDWMIESRLLEGSIARGASEAIDPEKYLHPPSLSSINELPPLQPEVGTPPYENRTFQPEVGTFSREVGTFSGVPTSLGRKNEDYSARNTPHYKTGHSQ
jgi:hypothetical protein